MRAFSAILIVGGLAIAGLGVHSYWTARQGERQAESSGRASSPCGRKRLLGRRTDTVARLSIERLASHWGVIEGAEKEELQRAPGHLIDTAPPGSKGNCVSP